MAGCLRTLRNASASIDLPGSILCHGEAPLGWGSAACDSVRIARLATQCGLFPVFEGQHGDVTAVTKIRQHVPVTDYLRPQRRFRHLFEPEPRTDVLARIQARADRTIDRFGLL